MGISLVKCITLKIGLLLLSVSCSTFNSNISKVYSNKSVDRDGKFTFKSKDKLTLYKDLTYIQLHKHSDGESGLEMHESGRYRIVGDTLILIPEVDIINFDAKYAKYIMQNNRLYHLDYKDVGGSTEPAFK